MKEKVALVFLVRKLETNPPLGMPGPVTLYW